MLAGLDDPGPELDPEALGLDKRRALRHLERTP